MLKTFVIGNVGNDAVINSINGRKAINFSVAENQKYTDANGEQQERTTWLNCVIWRDESASAKIAEYLKKGTQVYCEGRPDVEIYTNKNGQAGASFKLVVREIKLLAAAKEA